MAARGAFSSRTGFVLAAVGSAVGLGNLWRFPYLASTNGGASFLLLYIGLLFIIGIPALLAELSLGRHSSRNAVDAFGENGRRRAWSGAGFVALGATILLLSYYSVIAGWSLRYLWDAMTAWSGPPAYFDDPVRFFTEIAEGPAAIWTHLAFMVVTIVIVAFGVRGGIEKANLIMMPLLFLSVIALVIYANLQTGAQAGRDFYLKPDLGEIRASTISNAAGQTFFSIGLGLGVMLTYASYLGKDADMQRMGLTISLSDTLIAVLAGLMVFPLIFSLGLGSLVDDTGASSVGGLFIALPTAFANIGGAVGTLLAAAFFIMLTFAALSSALSLLEAPVSFVLDRFPAWGRVRAVVLLGVPIYLIGLFSALDLNVLGYADALVSRVLLIVGGLFVAVYVGWVRPGILDELEVGLTGFSMSGYFRPVIRYGLPVLLGALTALGVLGFLADIGVITAEPGTFLGDLVT